MNYELPDGCRDVTLLDMQILKRARIVLDEVQVGLLNSLLIKKHLIRQGRCPHDKDDVIARPKHQTQAGGGFAGMQVEFVCQACDKIVQPMAFEARAG